MRLEDHPIAFLAIFLGLSVTAGVTVTAVIMAGGTFPLVMLVFLASVVVNVGIVRRVFK